jgi:putative NIF3 family GTP cyclohydrolase 1 type 2
MAPVTASLIRKHFLTHAPWVDPQKTVDTIKSGDPDRPVRRVGVGWMASIWDLEDAHRDGCDLFITHEPTFNDHHDPEGGACRRTPPGAAKTRFLQESGLVVLRCHDAWDGWPKIGIRDSWARGLGLTDMVADNADAADQRGWHATYRIAPVALKTFAAEVARRTAPLGQDGVEVIGDPDRMVSRPSLGVGCGGPDIDMIEKGSDVLIVCYDGGSYWHDRERFAELGAAVITVEHGTSEMGGMKSLAEYLKGIYPGLDVRWYERHPRSWHVK